MTRRELRGARRVEAERAELTDAQIEAIVSEAVAAEASAARAEAAPPSSAIVWWRAQMRARREAAQLADAPITFVHALAIACGAGLALTLIGVVVSAVRGSLGWFTEMYSAVASFVTAIPSIDLNGSWVSVTLTAMLVSVVILSIAAVFVLRDE